jgi:hypothetical protein
MAIKAKKSVASLGIMDFNEWAGTKIANSSCDGSGLTVSRAPSKSMQSSL